MTLTEYARDLLNQFEGLSVGDINVDRIEATPINFSVEPEPISPVIKRYLNGDTRRLFSFQLLARQNTTSDAERVKNASLYERLAPWLESITRSRALPEMDDGRRAEKIEAVGAGYLAVQEDDATTAIYSMQIQITYYQKGSYAP